MGISNIDTALEDNRGATNDELYRIASFEAEIDLPIMAEEYWDEEWQKSLHKNKFKNAYDYMKWSLEHEDQPTFHQGGFVRSPLYKAVKRGDVNLRFAGAEGGKPMDPSDVMKQWLKLQEIRSRLSNEELSIVDDLVEKMLEPGRKKHE